MDIEFRKSYTEIAEENGLHREIILDNSNSSFGKKWEKRI